MLLLGAFELVAASDTGGGSGGAGGEDGEDTAPRKVNKVKNAARAVMAANAFKRNKGNKSKSGAASTSAEATDDDEAGASDGAMLPDEAHSKVRAVTSSDEFQSISVHLTNVGS